jgi:hypothetical protein
VVVATKREASPIDVHNVVIHELAHLALGAALGGRAPRWLDEGFAYLHSSDWSFARVRTLTGMVWTGDVIPLDEIERRFPAAESEVHRAYAQSYDFVAFLAKRGRYPDTADDGDRWPFQRFLILIGEGHDVYDASLEAFGAPLHDLFDEWRQDLRSRYMLLPIGMFALGVWVLAALLLIAAYIRKRRQNRTRLDEWERQEAEAHAGRTLVPLAPPPGGNHVADADDANAPSANVDPDRDRAVLDSDAPPQAKVLDFSTGAPIEPRADVRESDTDT